MARRGSGVRGATSMKIPPQVIVGCGYLADVIISLFIRRAVPFESGEEGSRNQTTEIGTVYSGWHRNYKLVKYGCTKCEVWRAHREVIETIPLNAYL